MNINPAHDQARPLKILHLTSTLPKNSNDNSTPNFIFRLTKSLNSPRHQNYILAPHQSGAAKEESVDGVIIHRFQYFVPQKLQLVSGKGGIMANLKNPLCWLQLPFFLIAELWCAMKIIKKYKIDIIQAHWIIPQGLISIFIKIFVNKPVVITSHGSDINLISKNQLLKKLGGWIIKKCDAYTTVSENLKNQIIQNYNLKKNIQVTPIGTDMEMFHPIKKNASENKYQDYYPLLLFIGRIEKEKGLNILLQAMPAVIKELPKCLLIAIGSGSLLPQYKKYVKDHRLFDSINLIQGLGYNQLPFYYAIADIFVSPSLHEGFGLSLVEALASETPVIATSTAGAKEIVVNDHNGILIPTNNPARLSEEIIKLAKNKNKLDELSKASRPSVEKKFSWANTNDTLHQIYDSITNP